MTILVGSFLNKILLKESKSKPKFKVNTKNTTSHTQKNIHIHTHIPHPTMVETRRSGSKTKSNHHERKLPLQLRKFCHIMFVPLPPQQYPPFQELQLFRRRMIFSVMVSKSMDLPQVTDTHVILNCSPLNSST